MCTCVCVSVFVYIHFPIINVQIHCRWIIVTLHSLTAHTPTGTIWVGTNNGNVIMMSVHVKSSATKEQSRTLELIPGGMCCPLYMCTCYNSVKVPFSVVLTAGHNITYVLSFLCHATKADPAYVYKYVHVM